MSTPKEDAPQNKGSSDIPWQSTAVAVAILVVLLAIEVTAVARYGADDALKVWGALGPLVGVVTGAITTYFFSRQAVDQADQRANEAQDRASSDTESVRGDLESMRGEASRIWVELTQRLAAAQSAVASTVATLDPEDAGEVLSQASMLFSPPPPPPSR